MNKPLTIEQLKSLEVGDWVWVENILGTKLVIDFRNGYYRKGLQDNKPDEHFTTSWYSYNLFFNYNLYGKTWLAYKNKEEAEGDIDYEIKYNALHANVIDHCYKMDNKDYRKHFYDMTIGNRMQLIEQSQAKHRGYSGFDEVKEMLSVIAGSKDDDLYKADSIKFVANELIAVLENLENDKANLEKNYIKLKNIVEQNNKLVWDRGEPIRKETAKEIFDEVIEACTVQLNAAEVDEYDNRYSKAWGRYWEGKISGAMNCRADILNIAKKYGVEVDE